jgi:molybdopterin-guanine dinucleotide biosynthesis protein A
VLAGGRGERLDGVHKPDLRLDGHSLLEHVLGTLTELGTAGIAVVGPRRPTPVPVTWTREEPPGGGPLAAVAAGLAGPARAKPATGSELTALLAADLAGLRAETLRKLVTALDAEPAADAAVLTDPSGRAQWLAAVWHTAALRSALERLDAHGGMPLRALYRRARVAEVPASAAECRDIDTASDARAAGLSPEENPHMYWPPLTE